MAGTRTCDESDWELATVLDVFSAFSGEATGCVVDRLAPALGLNAGLPWLAKGISARPRRIFAEVPRLTKTKHCCKGVLKRFSRLEIPA